MISTSGRSTVLGFLMISRRPGDAFRGGYLLTTPAGRPIQFHHTGLVRLTRTQQHFYGAGLEPFLFVESMAKPLTDRQTISPQAIFVNQDGLCELRRYVPAPVFLVHAAELAPREVEETHRPPRDNLISPRNPEPHFAFPDDLATLRVLQEQRPKGFDWLEPFARITRVFGELDLAPTAA